MCTCGVKLAVTNFCLRFAIRSSNSGRCISICDTSSDDKCHDTRNWVVLLPIVLLGIRTAIKEGLIATAAEMVYDTSIRLPAEFFVPTKQQANSEYASRLTPVRIDSW